MVRGTVISLPHVTRMYALVLIDYIETFFLLVDFTITIILQNNVYYIILSFHNIH